MNRMSMAGLIVLAGCGLLSGCNHAPKDAAGLVGTWQGDSSSVTTKWGYGKGQRTIVIKDASGTEFSGENSFTFKSDKPIDMKITTSYDKDAGTVTGTKPIIGTYDPKSGVVTIAEGNAGGGGVMKGKLINKDTLEIEYAEPGEWARVFRATLKRQSK